MISSVLEIPGEDDSIVSVKAALTGAPAFLVVSPIDLAAWQIGYTFSFRHPVPEGSDYKSVFAGIKDSFAFRPLALVTKYVLREKRH